MADSPDSRSILIAASGFIYAPKSSNNLGDRAQLTRTVERLRTAFPDSRLIAIANSLNDRGGFDDLEVSYSAIRYLTFPVTIPWTSARLPTSIARALRIALLLVNAKRIGGERSPVILSRDGRIALREMKESRALFISGAGAFNDNYVTGVGGFWGVLARCMSRLGKPVVASGQQIGPLRRFSRRLLAKWALRPVALLGVRDLRSIASATAVDVPPKRVVVTGDDAWELVPAPPEVAQAILERNGIDGQFIAAQIRFGASVGWDEADSRSFAVSLNTLSTELELPVVFVPSATALDADDRYAAACVRQHIDVLSWTLEEELDARTTKAILGRGALGVGTANHFCVFAASMGTPVVGLYASPYMEQKIIGVAELWPQRVAALPKATGLRPPALVAAARQLLEAEINRKTDEVEDRPSVTIQPDEPIRFLASLLTDPPHRPYSARFLESGSVEEYEHEFDPGRAMANVSDLECKALRSVLKQDRRPSFERHLDFACGTGRATGFVEGFADTTVGVDVSAAMLARAQERFPSTRFVRGDVMKDPGLLDRLGPFDLVTMWRFVAPAEPELRLAALSAVARSMEDGGVLVVNNNANRTSLHSAALLVRSLLRAPPRRDGIYRGFLSHRELGRLLQAVGLSVVGTKGVSYLPEQLTRRLPAWLWMPVERVLGRLNIAPQYSVNQLVVARRPHRQPSGCVDDPDALAPMRAA
jgi:polysaccharide pyruvyl transferase WcaK-like protein/SAM-dependent methyltransferase